MLEKEVIRAGEAFERLFANKDYILAQKWVRSQIQSTSGTILGPTGPTTLIKDFEDFKEQKGILLGLAMPQSYMEDVVRQMNVFKEERRLKEKRLEEEKRARIK